MTTIDVLAVATGGALGSVLRYGITAAAAATPGLHAVVGTTIANLIGCAAIAVFVVMGTSGLKSQTPDNRAIEVDEEIFISRAAGARTAARVGNALANLSPTVQVAIRVGLLGGLTTFSTFIAELVLMASSGQITRAMLYGSANLILGGGAFWCVTLWTRMHWTA